MRNRYEYNLAHFLAPSVVKDRTFRLMFLRAENYNPRTAARRIIKHFEYKATIWGNEKVATKINYMLAGKFNSKRAKVISIFFVL